MGRIRWFHGKDPCPTLTLILCVQLQSCCLIRQRNTDYDSQSTNSEFPHIFISILFTKSQSLFQVVSGPVGVAPFVSCLTLIKGPGTWSIIMVDWVCLKLNYVNVNVYLRCQSSLVSGLGSKNVLFFVSCRIRWQCFFGWMNKDSVSVSMCESRITHPEPPKGSPRGLLFFVHLNKITVTVTV
jgi:hypothetical protein